MPHLGMSTCRLCGKQSEVIYLCLRCAELFCSEECFRRHVSVHVVGSLGRQPGHQTPAQGPHHQPVPHQNPAQSVEPGSDAAPAMGPQQPKS